MKNAFHPHCQAFLSLFPSKLSLAIGLVKRFIEGTALEFGHIHGKSKSFTTV